MGKRVKIYGAAHASLTASPSTQAATASAGTLEVHAENRSMVPIDLELRSLHSSDVSVAGVSPATLSVTIHLPRRPNKTSARTPSTKKVTAGTWQPVSNGSAELKAIVYAAAPLVGSGDPKEDVNVT
jgi:hypothetical protein